MSAAPSEARGQGSRCALQAISAACTLLCSCAYAYSSLMDCPPTMTSRMKQSLPLEPVQNLPAQRIEACKLTKICTDTVPLSWRHVSCMPAQAGVSSRHRRTQRGRAACRLAHGEGGDARNAAGAQGTSSMNILRLAMYSFFRSHMSYSQKRSIVCITSSCARLDLMAYLSKALVKRLPDTMH